VIRETGNAYFGNGDKAVIDLAAARVRARQERMRANRTAACGICAGDPDFGALQLQRAGFRMSFHEDAAGKGCSCHLWGGSRARYLILETDGIMTSHGVKTEPRMPRNGHEGGNPGYGQEISNGHRASPRPYHLR
jgi:hypothetical protein